MTTEFVKLAMRVEELERRMRGAFRQGTVAEVDPAAGTLRLKLGVGAQGDFLSGNIPYVQTAGAVKVHNPPSVGQQMMAVSPNGDLRQAVAMPLGFSEANASPGSAGDVHKLTFGAVTIQLSSDGLSIASGGVSVLIDGSGLYVTGGTVEHNGTDISETHTHSGVTPGPSRTGNPQ